MKLRKIFSKSKTKRLIITLLGLVMLLAQPCRTQLGEGSGIEGKIEAGKTNEKTPDKKPVDEVSLWESGKLTIPNHKLFLYKEKLEGSFSCPKAKLKQPTKATIKSSLKAIKGSTKEAKEAEKTEKAAETPAPASANPDFYMHGDDMFLFKEYVKGGFKLPNQHIFYIYQNPQDNITSLAWKAAVLGTLILIVVCFTQNCGHLFMKKHVYANLCSGGPTTLLIRRSMLGLVTVLLFFLGIFFFRDFWDFVVMRRHERTANFPFSCLMESGVAQNFESHRFLPDASDARIGGSLGGPGLAGPSSSKKFGFLVRGNGKGKKKEHGSFQRVSRLQNTGRNGVDGVKGVPEPQRYHYKKNGQNLPEDSTHDAKIPAGPRLGTSPSDKSLGAKPSPADKLKDPKSSTKDANPPEEKKVPLPWSFSFLNSSAHTKVVKERLNRLSTLGKFYEERYNLTKVFLEMNTSLTQKGKTLPKTEFNMPVINGFQKITLPIYQEIGEPDTKQFILNNTLSDLNAMNHEVDRVLNLLTNSSANFMYIDSLSDQKTSKLDRYFNKKKAFSLGVGLISENAASFKAKFKKSKGDFFLLTGWQGLLFLTVCLVCGVWAMYIVTTRKESQKTVLISLWFPVLVVCFFIILICLKFMEFGVILNRTQKFVGKFGELYVKEKGMNLDGDDPLKPAGSSEKVGDEAKRRILGEFQSTTSYSPSTNTFKKTISPHNFISNPHLHHLAKPAPKPKKTPKKFNMTGIDLKINLQSAPVYNSLFHADPQLTTFLTTPYYWNYLNHHIKGCKAGQKFDETSYLDLIKSKKQVISSWEGFNSSLYFDFEYPSTEAISGVVQNIKAYLNRSSDYFLIDEIYDGNGDNFTNKEGKTEAKNSTKIYRNSVIYSMACLTTVTSFEKGPAPHSPSFQYSVGGCKAVADQWVMTTQNCRYESKILRKGVNITRDEFEKPSEDDLKSVLFCFLIDDWTTEEVRVRYSAVNFTNCDDQPIEGNKNVTYQEYATQLFEKVKNFTVEVNKSLTENLDFFTEYVKKIEKLNHNIQATNQSVKEVQLGIAELNKSLPLIEEGNDCGFVKKTIERLTDNMRTEEKQFWDNHYQNMSLLAIVALLYGSLLGILGCGFYDNPVDPRSYSVFEMQSMLDNDDGDWTVNDKTSRRIVQKMHRSIQRRNSEGELMGRGVNNNYYNYEDDEFIDF